MRRIVTLLEPPLRQDRRGIARRLVELLLDLWFPTRRGCVEPRIRIVEILLGLWFPVRRDRVEPRHIVAWTLLGLFLPIRRDRVEFGQIVAEILLGLFLPVRRDRVEFRHLVAWTLLGLFLPIRRDRVEFGHRVSTTLLDLLLPLRRDRWEHRTRIAQPVPGRQSCQIAIAYLCALVNILLVLFLVALLAHFQRPASHAAQLYAQSIAGFLHSCLSTCRVTAVTPRLARNSSQKQSTQKAEFVLA